MLKLDYYGQNDGTTSPNVTLTGDPGTDQLTLNNAGYLGGKIMAIVGTSTADGAALIAPCDSATHKPYGVLLNGPGEFAGAIGPSGSKKAPVVRALFKGWVDTQAYKLADQGNFVIGTPVYCGAGADAGLYVATNPTAAAIAAAVTDPTAAAAAIADANAIVGICTSVPTASNQWLGVASTI